MPDEFLTVHFTENVGRYTPWVVHIGRSGTLKRVFLKGNFPRWETKILTTRQIHELMSALLQSNYNKLDTAYGAYFDTGDYTVVIKLPQGHKTVRFEDLAVQDHPELTGLAGAVHLIDTVVPPPPYW